MIGVRVRAMPKRAVLDPQGEAVVSSLRSLGHDLVRDARVGRVIELVLDTDDEAEAIAAAERMCEQLLVNEVVEYGAIEVVEAGEVGAIAIAGAEVVA
jgi:phosphoribosylformylglycinamidine synthase PurS subunit